MVELTAQTNVSQEALIPFESLPDDIQQEHIQACESDNCKSAKIRLQQIRNEILILCHEAKAKEAEAWKHLATAGSLLTAAGSLYGAANAAAAIPIIGWIAAAVCYAAAAIFLAIALVFVGLAAGAFIGAGNIRGQINEKNSTFMVIANEVMTSCSEYCWPENLDPPLCP